jgi:hypothetical protein
MSLPWGRGRCATHPPASSALWRRLLPPPDAGNRDKAAHLSPLPCKPPHPVQADGQKSASFAGSSCVRVLGGRISEEHQDVTATAGKRKRAKCVGTLHGTSSTDLVKAHRQGHCDHTQRKTPRSGRRSSAARAAIALSAGHVGPTRGGRRKHWGCVKRWSRLHHGAGIG